MKQIKIAALIAVVIAVALVVANTVGVDLKKDGINLIASKQDTVTVKSIDKSKVGVENRHGQNVTVDGVSNDSTVTVK